MVYRREETNYYLIIVIKNYKPILKNKSLCFLKYRVINKNWLKEKSKFLVKIGSKLKWNKIRMRTKIK